MTFHHFLLGLVFVLGMTACEESKTADLKDCMSFKTGTFEYAGNHDVKVVRTETTQTEYNTKGEYTYTDKYNIGWDDDCTYYLTLISTDHPDDLDFAPDDTLWVKMDKITKHGYTFVAMKKGSTYRGELVGVEY